MGNIAEKLAYLAETKSRIGAAIESAGGDVYGKTFREYAGEIAEIAEKHLPIGTQEDYDSTGLTYPSFGLDYGDITVKVSLSTSNTLTVSNTPSGAHVGKLTIDYGDITGTTEYYAGSNLNPNFADETVLANVTASTLKQPASGNTLPVLPVSYYAHKVTLPYGMHSWLAAYSTHSKFENPNVYHGYGTTSVNLGSNFTNTGLTTYGRAMKHLVNYPLCSTMSWTSSRKLTVNNSLSVGAVLERPVLASYTSTHSFNANITVNGTVLLSSLDDMVRSVIEYGTGGSYMTPVFKLDFSVLCPSWGNTYYDARKMNRIVLERHGWNSSADSVRETLITNINTTGVRSESTITLGSYAYNALTSDDLALLASKGWTVKSA